MQKTKIIKNCYTTSIVPGYKIICNHGTIYTTYSIESLVGNTGYIFDMQSVSKEMLSMALEKGANAIINMNVSIANSCGIFWGDAVTLDPE